MGHTAREKKRKKKEERNKEQQQTRNKEIGNYDCADVSDLKILQHFLFFSFLHFTFYFSTKAQNSLPFFFMKPRTAIATKKHRK